MVIPEDGPYGADEMWGLSFYYHCTRRAHLQGLWSSWLLLEASRGHWIHSRAGIGAVVLLAPRDERRLGTRTQLWTVPITEVIAREGALGGIFQYMQQPVGISKVQEILLIGP